jgi:hypothetical protein
LVKRPPPVLVVVLAGEENKQGREFVDVPGVGVSW